MKRRNFGLMATASAAALTAGMPKPARAAVSAAQAALLQTTLTPLGAERAGNADGSIPAWTGGDSVVPADYDQNNGPFPDKFADEKPIVVINAANMAQYADRLSEGAKYMMTNQGFSIEVYPTHRTHCEPQYVYDFAAQNAVNVIPNPGGSRLGFTNGYGGPPFPILNEADPYEGGPQAIWNHLVRWNGFEYEGRNYCGYSIIDGVVTQLEQLNLWSKWYWNDPKGSVATFKGIYGATFFIGTAPANQQGSEAIVGEATNPLVQKGQGWSYFTGQGRVRKTPEVEYDIPLGLDGGLLNYDEANIFLGALDDYDWKLIGKKEMYIPYNANRTLFMEPSDLGPHFTNPEKVRWELHRCWEVEVSLHPGKRNVVPRRTIYLDEDTHQACLSTEYDAQGNIWKATWVYLVNAPNMPGQTIIGTIIHNFQQNGWVASSILSVNVPPAQRKILYQISFPDSILNPQSMAAQANF